MWWLFVIWWDYVLGVVFSGCGLDCFFVGVLVGILVLVFLNVGGWKFLVFIWNFDLGGKVGVLFFFGNV